MVLGLFALVLVVGLVVDIFVQERIILDEEKIISQNVITLKQNFFYYKDIACISSHHHKEKRIQDFGYFSRIYEMKDGRILHLSPDAFENYGDIVSKISYHTTHLE
ncbi:MAG: hypothetical protein ACO1NP_10825 [Flavobacterium sp.]